jgi:hypothetical protein
VGGNLNMTGTGAAKAVTLVDTLTVDGNADIGALTTTAKVTITFNGATASITSYTAKASDDDTFAGSAILTIDTLADVGTASKVTFDGTTAITNKLTVGDNGLTIAGTGAVTLKEAPETAKTSTKKLVIKSAGGVTLEKETTIAANIKAAKVTIKGTSSAGTEIIADSDALTVAADDSIVVPTTADGGSIVAGGTENKVTIAGATLGKGTYTATTGKLSLGTTAVIKVDGGIEIAGTGNLELTLAATKVVLNASAVLDVKAATGKFGEATQAETLVSVAGDQGNAKVVKDAMGAIWTVSDDDTGTDISTAANNIVLGTLVLDFDGTSAVNNDPCATTGTPNPNAAPGKLITGAGTTITFIGTGTG